MIDTSNVTAFMRILVQIWDKMSRTPVPGVAGLTWSSLLVGVACISLAIAILNRFTGTEGLGLIGSASDSVSMGVKNHTIRRNQREAAKAAQFKAEQDAIISKYRKR